VTVRVPRGVDAGWVVDVDGTPHRLSRAQLRDGKALDEWRRAAAGNPALPDLVDPRGAALSCLHRLSQWAR
jgi:muconolactone delta-isomerase